MAGRAGVYIAYCPSPHSEPFFNSSNQPFIQHCSHLTNPLHSLIRRNGIVVALTNLRRGEKVTKETKTDITPKT